MARVHVLRGQDRVFGFTLDEQGANLPRQYGPWTCLDDKLFARSCIGTPGPNKRDITGYLKPVWDEAILAIHNAEAIVFVGYRFPPSDSDARDTILEAVQGNDSPHLLLHTVLGPNVNDESTSRLRGLLESRMS